jgi:hypothetical protein
VAGFGCTICLPPDANDARSARAGLTAVTTLIDEAHYIVSLAACPRCRQRFVSVFTETIDWVNGEDPQRWTIMPISESDAVDLVSYGPRLQNVHLTALPARRSLLVEHPSEADVTARWSFGIEIRHHD